jgi:glycerol-3-phosphate dehydrogenase
MAHVMNKESRGLGSDVIKHLIYNYGSEYKNILAFVEEKPEWGERVSENSEVIIAEVIHAIRKEMAQKLSDVLFRRTDLGSASYPHDGSIRTVAEVMTCELGWDEEKKEREIEEALAIYAPLLKVFR